MSFDEPNIENITGFAGAKFSECVNKADDKRPTKNPLRKLFDSDVGEMFEGTESFTWISRDQDG